jgi:hypothetical protein
LTASGLSTRCVMIKPMKSSILGPQVQSPHHRMMKFQPL